MYLVGVLGRHDANIVNIAATESERMHVSKGDDALKYGIHTRFFLNIDKELTSFHHNELHCKGKP